MNNTNFKGVMKMTTESPQKNPILWIAGGIVLVLVLASAAFVGGRLSNAQKQPPGGPGKFVMINDSGPGGSPQTVELKIEEAPELPGTSPDIVGVFARREDKSLFVGTGNVRFAVKAEAGGAPQTSASYDGPVVEIVVTHETQVYKDVTEMRFDNPPTDGKIKQVVEPGSIEDLGSNNFVRAWGEKQGDRFIASILVYQ
jgi:hypothetical protein